MAGAGGRPSDYQVGFNKQAFKLCLLGATDKELADFFGVTEKTLNTWKEKHPRFLQSLKDGKENADANVSNRLYNRALGYSHPDVHITSYEGDVTLTPITKHYPPDPTSCIFWLKNRQRGKWRDRQEVEHSGTLSLEQLVTGPDA
jgi:hypothetical protein